LESPLISIITVSLNAERYIEQTIQSVSRQTYKNIEYIVVDGGSTDGTIEIINKYRDKIDRFVSEKDEGIAAAMNKGVSLATGDYVIFLHADDFFAHDYSLENVIQSMDKTADIIACNIQFGKHLKIYKPRGFNFWFNFKGMPHQGILCHRSLIEKFNGFDKQFLICMDYDLFLKAYRHGAKLNKVSTILAVMRDTGISSRNDWISLKNRFNEERQIHQKNCHSVFLKALYKLYWPLYILYRYMLCTFKGVEESYNSGK